MARCKFVKLTKERGKIANIAMVKGRKKSNAEKIKKDKLKRLREFNSWFK
tara:strand:+ start:7122 stop:7271 length:150 start_codon:yes stop_codon:yes gene_type:complete